MKRLLLLLSMLFGALFLLAPVAKAQVEVDCRYWYDWEDYDSGTCGPPGNDCATTLEPVPFCGDFEIVSGDCIPASEGWISCPDAELMIFKEEALGLSLMEGNWALCRGVDWYMCRTETLNAIDESSSSSSSTLQSSSSTTTIDPGGRTTTIPGRTTSVEVDVSVCEQMCESSPDSQCMDCCRNNGVWTELGCITPTQEGVVAAVMRIFVGIVTAIAVIRFIQAGLMFNTDDQEKIKEAKSIATSAIIAIIFAAAVPIILNFIGVKIIDIGQIFN